MNQSILWPLAVTVCLLLACVWHQIQRAHGKTWPRNSFLYRPEDRFTDWTYSHLMVHKYPNPYIHQMGTVNTPYFPLVYFLLKMLSGHHLVGVYRAIYVVLSICFVQLFALPQCAAIVLAVSYPVLFSDDRGSLDHIVCVLAGCGVGLLLNGHPAAGAVALALAVSLKGYPATFFLLWALQGQWIGLGTGIASTVALILLPCLSFEGGIRASLWGLRAGMAEYKSLAVDMSRGPVYCTSHYCCDWFSLVHLLHLWRSKSFNGRVWAPWVTATMTAMALALTWRAATTETLWIAVLALGLIQIVWPLTCNDYKLCALFPGIALWLNAGAPNWTIWTCLVLLFVPKNYWFPNLKTSLASISCAVSPVIVAVLIWEVMR